LSESLVSEATMPIYAYKCSSCGHGTDVMQKISDAPLTVCTACGQPTFAKQITAAGFQLKGSGWYATDFKNGSKGAKKEHVAGENTAEKGAEKAAEKTSDAKSETKSSESSTETKAASTAGKTATGGGSST
jgi:putative FmdB family regulatory protein